VLGEKDGYGYDVVRRLRDAGLPGVGDASVYGTLVRHLPYGPGRRVITNTYPQDSRTRTTPGRRR
jgi:hypothetical protein